MKKFYLFRKTTHEAKDGVLICQFTEKKQLDAVLLNPENHNMDFYILNEKNEVVDRDLNVMILPTTSMESMVGLLQNRFSRK